jgi:hypothetical protein
MKNMGNINGSFEIYFKILFLTVFFSYWVIGPNNFK